MHADSAAIGNSLITAEKEGKIRERATQSCVHHNSHCAALRYHLSQSCKPIDVLDQDWIDTGISALLPCIYLVPRKLTPMPS